MSCQIRMLFFVLLLLQLSSPLFAAQQPLQTGDFFPEIQLLSPAAGADRAYLQLDGSRFTPSQIGAELLLIEFLNVHCPHCQMQAPAYNELFKLIEANPETRGKIKLLAIAVGNLEKEVEIFRQAYQVAFPILADPQFAAWRKMGANATPLSFYVRQDRSGQAGIISGMHSGMNNNYQRLYQGLVQMAAVDPQRLKQQVQTGAKQRQQLQPILTEQQLEYQVRTALTRFGGIEDFDRLSLLSGRQVYTAVIRRGEERERLFAEVTSRSSVCDVCHDVHFIYLFDSSVRVIGFEPLQLTKYGNVNWNQQEITTMRKRVVGRYLSLPQPFDPAVDAISSATMTSAIIFDSLAQGEELLKELREQGLL